jgi:hypothetical protein
MTRKQQGATTLSIITLGITTLGITTLIITTLSIKTLSITTLSITVKKRCQSFYNYKIAIMFSHNKK